MSSPVEKISAAGIPVYLYGFSAIDLYLGKKNTAAVHAVCKADLTDLARLFEGLRYPGSVIADAAIDSDGKTWYFRCEDTVTCSSIIQNQNISNYFLEFYQDCKNRRFYDPNGIYPFLRNLRDGVQHNGTVLEKTTALQWLKEIKTQTHPRRALCDGALLIAKYFPETSFREINIIAENLRCSNGETPGIEEQRMLLTGLLETANPSPGFELLNKSGYISNYWPELAMLNEVDQSKECHPEGNVWKHTMEALRHRKPSSGGFDLRLSLGLLLHDSGKPFSKSTGNKRFDGHAELGGRQVRRFLKRLGFDNNLINDVYYLVRNHMLPAALPRLPLIRTGEIMASPLFPALLELYRCDESSSFKGLDDYYKSSAAYRTYLKHSRNPYRNEIIAQMR